MKGKACECYGIYLIDSMTQQYARHLARPMMADKPLGNLAGSILNHLEEQFKEGDFKDKQEPYHGLFAEMRSSVTKFQYGGDSGLHAMEMVRNRIHKNDELKQLMVCGTPYTDKKSLSETAKVLAQAFDTLEETTPEEAKAILDKQYEKLSCLD